jgi:hypothetical protein
MGGDEMSFGKRAKCAAFDRKGCRLETSAFWVWFMFSKAPNEYLPKWRLWQLVLAKGELAIGSGK